VEVFNLLFIAEQDKKFVVHCLDCALKMNAKLENFVILEQYKMDELLGVSENFQLGTVVSSGINLFHNKILPITS
jgi:hypothetical protein